MRAKIVMPLAVTLATRRSIVSRGAVATPKARQSGRRVPSVAYVHGSISRALPGGPACLDLLHLLGEAGRGQDALLEQEDGEGGGPAFVVAQPIDHLGPERLDAAALLLGADELVVVENVGQRVAALLPGGEFVFHAREGGRRAGRPRRWAAGA